MLMGAASNAPKLTKTKGQKMSRVRQIPKSETTDAVTEMYEELERTRGGSVPNLFQALGYNAGMLGPALNAAAFVGAESKVPVKDKQLAYLAASRLNDCEYCLERHKVAALKVGFREEQAEALYKAGELADDAAFDPREKALIRYAEELSRTATSSPETFAALREFYNDEEIVEITFSVATANMFNRLVSGLGVELEPEFRK